MKLKVLSLNCFGAPQSFNRNQRFEKIGHELIDLNPNIIALQEVYFSNDRDRLLSSFNRDFLSYYSKGPLKTTVGGLITLISGFKSEDVGFNRFNDQGPIALLPLFDRLAPKGFQHIKLFQKDRVIDFINVHFICVYKDKQNYRLAYSNQMKQLIEYIVRNCGVDVLIAGDLNRDAYSDEIIRLKSELKLYESLNNEAITVSSENTNRKGLTNIYSGYRSFRTDYVFSSQSVEIVSAKIVLDELYDIGHNKSHLSDHFGVMSEIDI